MLKTTPAESAAWAEAQVCRSRAARAVNVFDLRPHRVVAQAEASSPTAIEAADAARRSYPQPERRLSDIGSGIRLAEHHVPGLAAHAVSEIGHPAPSEAPRIPRDASVSPAALYAYAGVAIALTGVWVAWLGDMVLAWLRGLFA